MILKFLRYFAVSFSLFSRIPMPRFVWKEEDMSYAFVFFPLVGALIGGLILLLNLPERMSDISLAVRVLLTLAVPILITGGIHIDGYMDTEDALRSYASPERRQEILKDPHIGAFAVIGLVRILLIYAASVILILKGADTEPRMLMIFALTFAAVRCVSGLTAFLYPKAKKEGMLYEETKGGGKIVPVILTAELAVISAAMIGADPLRGTAMLLSFGVCAVSYRVRALRDFGGVTGDTTGHFLVDSETVSAAVLAVCALILP